MRKRKKIKKLEPYNHWCIWCALLDEGMIEAEYTYWDNEQEKMFPLCAAHFEMITESEPMFINFSLN